MPSLFSQPEIRIEAPPPPPAAPPTPQPRALSAQELDLIQKNLGLLERNIAIQDAAERQDAATRAAIEKSTGVPLSDLIAQEALRARSERTAFEKAVGMPYENFIAQQAREQADLGTQQRALQKQIIDQAAEERAQFIAATGITPEQAQAEEANRQLVLARGLGDRFSKAVAGTLPVSPGLERSLGDQRGVLESSLREALGPGYATSTPGIVALAEFDKRAEELRDAARTGAISEAEQVGFGLVPATERVRTAREGALRAGPLQGGLERFTGSQDYTPYSARGFLATPPQLAALENSFASDRALDFQGRLAGYGGTLQTGLANYQGQQQYVNALNQGRIGLAGAQAQAQGDLLGSTLAAAGYYAGRRWPEEPEEPKPRASAPSPSAFWER